MKKQRIRVDDTGDESLVAQRRSYETQVLRVKDLPPNKKGVWHRAWDDCVPEESANDDREDGEGNTEHTTHCTVNDNSLEVIAAAAENGIAANQGHHVLDFEGELLESVAADRSDLAVRDASDGVPADQGSPMDNAVAPVVSLQQETDGVASFRCCCASLHLRQT